MRVLMAADKRAFTAVTDMLGYPLRCCYRFSILRIIEGLDGIDGILRVLLIFGLSTSFAYSESLLGARGIQHKLDVEPG